MLRRLLAPMVAALLLFGVADPAAAAQPTWPGADCATAGISKTHVKADRLTIEFTGSITPCAPTTPDELWGFAVYYPDGHASSARLAAYDGTNTVNFVLSLTWSLDPGAPVAACVARTTAYRLVCYSLKLGPEGLGVSAKPISITDPSVLAVIPWSPFSGGDPICATCVIKIIPEGT